MDARSREAVLARSALAFVASLVIVTMMVNGSPMGASAGPLQASESPSPSGGGTGGKPAIKFLNPSPAYNPHLFPEDPEETIVEDPKISDKYDGVDEAYHVVAAIANPPANLVVEASIQYADDNAITIGEMTPVASKPNVYELFWDIPANLPAGAATMTVHLFQQSGTGFEEVANDSVAVEMRHVDDPPDSVEIEETAEMTWPEQGGELGFYKPRGGAWRVVVQGFTSAQTLRYMLIYSTTTLGQTPVFKECSGFLTPGATVENRKAFAGQCTLVGQDLPTAVTAVGVIALDIDITGCVGVCALDLLSMDAADVHVVRPYVQTPEQMTITLIPVPSGNMSNEDGDTSDRARDTGDRCLAWVADVKDHLGRPVTGANIDVHIQGPNDALQFGDDTVDTGGAPGTYKNPDKGGHSSENGIECSDVPDGSVTGTQADHNVPGGDDIKHRESVGGTGVGGAAGPGQWKFYIYSEASPGFTDITAWVDDESIADLKDTRPLDNDVLDDGEPVATARAQWYSVNPTLDFVPLGESSPAGTCTSFLLKARAGTAAIPGINIDVHATGPDESLDFCDPGGGSPRRAPDKGEHDAEDAGESGESTGSPRSQHTEGETNEEGNLVIGVVSPVTGDTSLIAWIDGEAGFDDDVQGAADAEPSSAATMSWASSSGEAKVNFLNPSPYGDTTQVANTTDADGLYHIVLRVDAPSLIEGVDVQLGTGSGATFVKTADLGRATHVSGTDTYELKWNVAVEDGDYTLRAVIAGTSVATDQSITVHNEAAETDPFDAPDETIELTRPLNDQPTSFSRRSTPVDGIASAGAEGVDVFYTKAPANKTLVAADWINCGFLQLDGTGSVPQPFRTTCVLKGADQAAQITGIAVAPFDCMEPVPGAGCDAAPDALPEFGRNPGTLESGDAHRIFGFEANPIIDLSPPENEAAPGDCSKFVLRVVDQTGQALPAQNVDVHLTGPGDAPHFCDPPDGSATARRAPDQGGHSLVADHGDEGAHVSETSDTEHTEGETTSQGRFIFGVRGNASGDSTIGAWVDRTDDDVPGGDEVTDSSLMHWRTANGTGNGNGNGNGNGSGCTQVGTAKGDVLRGTAGKDKICGKGGNDVIRGAAGDDVLRGNRGNDRVKGGSGNDTINLSRGKDRGFGNKGKDALKGAAGRDRLNGGSGTDRCDGGKGRDRIRKCESGSRAPAPRLVRGGVA